MKPKAIRITKSDSDGTWFEEMCCIEYRNSYCKCMVCSWADSKGKNCLLQLGQHFVTMCPDCLRKLARLIDKHLQETDDD